MNTKIIAELVKLMDIGNLKSLEACEGEMKIKLEKNSTNVSGMGVPVQIMQSPVVKHESVSKAELKSEVLDFNKLNEVRSPLVGVFYASPSPDSSPFVKIGQKVKKGDVLCIIEAMKQMNEINAEVDCEVVDVCVKNGDIVEFNQILFKIY